MVASTMKLKTWVFLLSALLFMAGCKTKYIQVPVKEKVYETVTEEVRDTTILTVPDSTWYRAFIDCKNGKPVLKNPKDSGNRPGLNKPKVNLDTAGKLTIDCEARAQELFLQWKARHKQTIIEKEVPIYIEKELGKWQKFFLELGKYSFFVLVLVAVISAIKLFKK